MSSCRNANVVVSGIRSEFSGRMTSADGHAECLGTEAVGGFCPDGSIYLGTAFSTMYAVTQAGCDAGGCTGSDYISTFWAPPGSPLSYTNFGINSVNGFSNTNTMALNSSGAAMYCQGLNTGGHTDWYLPSQQEMAALILNYNSAGGTAANFVNQFYWTSSETGSLTANRVNWVTGGVQNTNKASANYLRCIRQVTYIFSN